MYKCVCVCVCVCLNVQMCVCISMWKTIINSCIFYRIWPYLGIDYILAGDRCHA